MKGKEKCKILKEIRAQIAAANDIAWVTEECPHKGDCRGTCPKCEAEVATLERALARRRALGKTVAVVGLSAGLIATTTACDALSSVGGNQLDGDMTAPVSTTMAIAGGMALPPETVPPVPGEVEVDGDYALLYYTTDFTPCDRVTYVADRLLYVEQLQDFNYSDDSIWEIPIGEAFDVIGVGQESKMVLLEYGGQQYALWEGDLPQSETPQ